MNPKMLWASALMRFGLVPIALASVGATVGLVALVALIYHGVASLLSERAASLGFALFFLSLTLLIAFSFILRSFRRAVVATLIVWSCSFAYVAALVWGELLVTYINNGFVSDKTVRSPWPFVDINLGVWWLLKLTFGLTSACAVIGLSGFTLLKGFKKVWKNISLEVKRADSEVRKKAQESVEHQQLRSKYVDVLQAKGKAEAL